MLNQNLTPIEKYNQACENFILINNKFVAK